MSIDNVNHPKHYGNKEYEPIKVIPNWLKNYPTELIFQVGNTLKYISRAADKGKFLEDLEKAQFYLNDAISLYKKSNNIIPVNPKLIEKKENLDENDSPQFFNAFKTGI